MYLYTPEVWKIETNKGNINLKHKTKYVSETEIIV